MRERDVDQRLVTGLAVTGLGLAVQHWFPWARRLPRLAAYTLGTAAIAAGQAVWLGPRSRTFRGLALFPLLGGLVVYACWGYDWAANRAVRWALGRRARLDLSGGREVAGEGGWGQ